MRDEDRLLLTCVQVGSGSAQADREESRRTLEALARGGADWDHLFDAAWTHGVTPLVHRGLQEVRSGLVPEHVLERMRQAFHKQGLMIHLQVQELREVLNTFSHHDVPVIVFKGPALAVQAYGNAAIRKPGDLDLLIPKDAFAHARTLLNERGYRSHVAKDDEERYLDTRGGSAFTRGPFQIDLHWTLEQRRFDSVPFSFQLPLEEVWRDSVEVPLNGGTVRTLSPAHHFLFVAFHGAKHYWQKLYLVCDVAQLIRSFPDLNWASVAEEAQRLRISRIVALAAHLAERYLHTPLPAALDKAEGDGVPLERAGDWLFGRRSVDMGCHLFRMGLLERLPDKISYVFNRSWRKISKFNWHA